MKKTNFIVIFWLLLALISFVVFVINFSSFWNALSFWVIPTENVEMWGMDKEGVVRTFIKVTPMIILSVATFIIAIKQGMKNYHKN